MTFVSDIKGLEFLRIIIQIIGGAPAGAYLHPSRV